MQQDELVVVTQGLLGGVIWQAEDMPAWLRPFAEVMPLKFANDALRGIRVNGEDIIAVGDSLLILALFAAGAVLLSSWTAKRAHI